MVLEDSPAAFHGVVLAVVGRVVGESNVDVVLLDELHHAVQELASTPAVLGTVVLEEDERVDLREAGLVLDPPRIIRVDDAVAGHLGRADCDRKLVVLGKQKAHGSRFAVRLVVVIERSNRHPAFAVARELTDLDCRLGIRRDQQLVVRPRDFVADAFDLLEDGVGFSDLFLTWVFCTRTG